MKLQRIDKGGEEPVDVIATKLWTEKGTIPRAESYDFSKDAPIHFRWFRVHVPNWLLKTQFWEPQVI